MNGLSLPRASLATCGLLAAAAIAGCGERGGPPGVTEEPWAQEDAPRIAFEHVGSACGDGFEHWRAAAGLVFDGGAVAVRHGDASVLFCAGGALVGRAGGEGEGPGEFKNTALNWVADGARLAIPDIGLRRVTVFTDLGRFDRSIAIRAWRASDVTGLLPDGRVALLASGPHDVAPLVAIGEAERVDTLAVIRGPTEARISFRFETPEGPVTLTTLQGGCLPQVFSAVVGPDVYVVRGDSGMVHRVRDGGLHPLYATPALPRLTSADLDALRRSLNRAPQDTVLAVLGRYGSVGAIAPVVWGRAVVDPAGRLWLGRSSCEKRYPSLWEVVDTSGVLVGWAETPPMSFMAVRGETAMFLRGDSLDVEYVELFRVSYPNAGARR